MPLHLPRKPRPSRKKHYAFVIPDTHVGYIMDTPTYSIPAWDVAMQALRLQRKRVTHVIILGDFGNWESMSRWSAIRADQAYMEEDVALVNARLDEVQRIIRPGTKVVFLEGNHEAWAGLFEAKYPALRDAINLKRRLRFRERGWQWVPENHLYRLGDAHFTHGHLRGARTPADLIKLLGVSVIVGHTHAYATASLRTLTGEHAAWQLGCLASIEPPPPYARGALPGAWVHGFGNVQVRANGRFQVGFRRIIDEAWTELEDGTEIRVDVGECRRRYDEDQAVRERLREEYGERYYLPGGRVVNAEPHYGAVGAGHKVARNRRARIVKGM